MKTIGILAFVFVCFFYHCFAFNEKLIQENRIRQQNQQFFTQLRDNFLQSLHEFQKSNEVSVQSIWGDLHTILEILSSSSFPTAVSPNVNEKCHNDSVNYVHNLFSFTDWALRMYESSGKMPLGLWEFNNLHAVGLFDECLRVKAPDFQGKYCTAYFTLLQVDTTQLPPSDGTEGGNWLATVQGETERDSFVPVEQRNLMTWFQILGLFLDKINPPPTAGVDAYTYINPSIGMCIPSSCSADEFRRAVADVVGGWVSNGTAIVIATDEEYCFVDSSEQPSFDGPDIAVLVTLSIIGCLVVIATLQESWRLYIKKPINNETDSVLVRAVHCFSALNNGRKILSTKSSEGSLSCIHGIRFLSTTWVIMGHSWMQGMYLPNINLAELIDQGFHWEMQGISNATVSVDSFYVISGLLVSYLLLRELEKNKGKFNVILFYVHRYLRLTPVYAIIMGFIATLIVYLGSGPNWYTVHYLSEGCRNGWWMQILYVNNLVPRALDEICMGETWYIATDMQLFLISPLFIYPLWRWRKNGLIWLAVFTMASLAANITMFTVIDMSGMNIVTRYKDGQRTALNYFDYYYQKPWVRAPPYLVGIFLGWVLFVTRKKEIHLPKPIVAMCWALATAIALAVIYGIVPYLDEEKVKVIDKGADVMYGSFHRFAWGIALAWVIFACIKGYGGFVNRLLSWKGFMPLSRLTYCVYLIHLNYITLFYAHSRLPMYYTTYDQIHTYFGFLVEVFGISFIVSVTVEASFLNLEKLILSPFARSKPAGDAVPKKSELDEESIPKEKIDNLMRKSSQIEKEEIPSHHINNGFVENENIKNSP